MTKPNLVAKISPTKFGFVPDWWWLGATRQQAIVWDNVDTYLCPYVASIGHSKLFSRNVWQIFYTLINQAGKLALARSPMRVKIWPGKWKTGLDEWIFV